MRGWETALGSASLAAVCDARRRCKQQPGNNRQACGLRVSMRSQRAARSHCNRSCSLTHGGVCVPHSHDQAALALAKPAQQRASGMQGAGVSVRHAQQRGAWAGGSAHLCANRRIALRTWAVPPCCSEQHHHAEVRQRTAEQHSCPASTPAPHQLAITLTTLGQPVACSRPAHGRDGVGTVARLSAPVPLTS